MRAAILGLLCLTAATLPGAENQQYSLEQLQTAIRTPSPRKKIAPLVESMVRSYSLTAEILLARAILTDPALAVPAAKALFARLSEDGAVPDLRLACWMCYFLRNWLPADCIPLDRWIEMEKAAIASGTPASLQPEGPAMYYLPLIDRLKNDQLCALRFDDALATLQMKKTWLSGPDDSWLLELATSICLAVQFHPEDAGWQKKFRTAMQAVIAGESALTDSPDDLLARGNWYLSVNCPEDAKRIAATLAEKYPDWLPGLYFRINLLRALRDFAALEQQAAAFPADDMRRRLFLIPAALGRGDPDTAVTLMQQSRMPGEPFPELAMALIYGKRFTEAEKEIALLAMPEQEKMQTILAICRGTPEAVLPHLQQREKELQGGDRIMIRVLLFEIIECTRDRTLLQHYWNRFQAAGELRDPVMANMVGYVAAELDHRLPEARKLIEQAITVNPFEASFQDSMAWVLYKQGELTEARKWIERSLAGVEKDGDYTVIAIHAGDICAALKDYPAARKYYQMALELRPYSIRHENVIRGKMRKLI